MKNQNIVIKVVGILSIILGASVVTVFACHGTLKTSNETSCSLEGQGCGYKITAEPNKKCDISKDRNGKICNNKVVSFIMETYDLGLCVNGHCEDAVHNPDLDKEVDLHHAYLRDCGD